jgi:DDE superfamily endonuclease
MGYVTFSSSLPGKHFRRMFRMSLQAFNLLCSRISTAISEERFRPEALYPPRDDVKVPGIPGEVKVAVAIRMLAGGSYLDLAPLFDVSTSHLYQILDDFLSWILDTFEFPLVGWLRQRKWHEITSRAAAFAEKTDGVFYGPFAALDGLAVRVRCPSESDVGDPGNYYCRKGFHAINVQGICDKSKRILWCYPSNKGSTHDSAAFAGSKLYELLKEVSTELYNCGCFVVGDSAYAISSFLITPYETEEMRDDPLHSKDAFNYHLSSCRIFIECAFGEVVMRWGILWRTLLFDLKKSAKIVQVCMLLHNFIIDARESETDCCEYFKDFQIRMDALQLEVTKQTGEIPRPMVTDNNEPRVGGRRRVDEEELRVLGEELRRRLTGRLAARDLRRPLQHDMHYNAHGHIYIASSS